jgi:hypothetical protein
VTPGYSELWNERYRFFPPKTWQLRRLSYVGRLGFRVIFEASEDGRSGLLGVERGKIQMTLDSPMKGHGRNACVALQVYDADAYHHEWSAKVHVLRAPK